ncbi:MAG: SIS domain-containing protein [Pseudonocardia sp.]
MIAVLDDTLLDDAAALAAVDTAGFLRSAATAGAQLRAAAQAAEESGVVRALAGSRPRALVLLRRPGTSRWAAPILAALLGDACPVPVVLADSAPAWIGPLDVLVAHTADPGDRELAESVHRAAQRRCEVVLSAPMEGPIAAAGAGSARLLEPRVPVPPGLDLPRALSTGLVTASALGLLRVDLETVAAEIDRELERDHPSHEPFVNPAKTLALRLAERTPLLWGTDAVATEVAGYAAAALARHAGIVAHAADVAEAAGASALQRLLMASAGREDVFHDPFDDPAPGSGAAPPRVVLLSTDDDDPTAAVARRTGRGWPSADLVHLVEEVPPGSPHGVLTRAVLTATRFDLAALYLGLAGSLLGTDRAGPRAGDPDTAAQLSGPA